MKLSVHQIRNLTAEVFTDASRQEEVSLKHLAEGLDVFAKAAENSTSLKIFDEINWSHNSFGNEPYLSFMASFQKRYFKQLTTEMIGNVSNILKEDLKGGFLKWYNYYADALMSWKEYVANKLCEANISFTDVQKSEIHQLVKLNKYIQESDWIAAFPFFENLVKDDRLTNEHRSYFNLILAEIIIYWKPSEEAAPYIEKAKELYPEGEDILITLGKYYIRKSEYQKGREILFNAASKNKNKSEVYNSIGDSYKDEGNLEEARAWYEKALELNFLNSNVYAKFFSLQKENADLNEINHLLHLVKTIESEDPCSTVLYNAYREAAFEIRESGNTEAAINYFQKAIDLRPDLQLVKLDIAYEYSKAGNKDKAINMVRDIVVTEPLNYNAWLALSYFYELHAEIDQAVNAYQKCLTLQPKESANIYSLMGAMYQTASQWEDAIKYYKLAASEKPTIANLENLKKAYESKGEDKNVIELTNQLIEHPSAINQYNYYNQLGIYFYNKKELNACKEAIKYYLKSIEMNPTEPILYENLGLAYEQAGDLNNAEEVYKKAIEFEKANGRYFNRLALYYYSKAFSVDSSEERDHYLSQAIDFYLKASEREPNNVTYYYNVALAYEKVKLFQQGIMWYEKVLLQNENDAKAQAGAGYCSYMDGQWAKAVEHFRHAILIEPWRISYYDHLGYVFEQQGNFTEAIQNYREALAAIEKNKQDKIEDTIKADYFYNRIGVIYYNSNDLEKVKKSIEEYQKAIQVNSSISVYHLNLGLSYVYVGEYFLAIESCKKASELNPNDAGAYNIQGVAYYRMAHLPDSIESYHKAIELDHNNPVYYDNIALASYEDKRYQEAEEYWLRAFELNSENKEYLKSLQQLYQETNQEDKLKQLIESNNL